MPEHYTKLTVSVSVWCNKCGRQTTHRVDSGRRGPCMACLAKLDADKDARDKQTPPAEQIDLFGGK